MNEEDTKLKIVAVMAAMLLSLYAYPAFAQTTPTPHGITGMVLDLDGLTQAPAGTSIGVNNTATGQSVQGVTGKPGNMGKYAASIDGTDGDTIIVYAWNREHSASKAITLSGVMRDVNVLLNLTLLHWPPTITSAAATAATEDLQYSYDVEAYDDNLEDTLTYSLAAAPSGMSINGATGMIYWLPGNSDVGSHNVAVNVSDGNLSTQQTFAIVVANTNDAPAITSNPATTGREDSNYTYQTTATDDDNDNLTYVLSVAPGGMAISNQTGAISWLPLQQNTGANSVTVTVLDGNGGQAQQSFSITVDGVNDQPQILSAAVTAATQDAPYYYDVQATDEDGDALAYWLVQKPGGMSIDGSTGLISWKPNSSHVGLHSVTLRVTDSTLLADQSFTITVGNVNDLPVVLTAPVTAARQGEPYTYDINASDIDNDTINYSLAAAPEGMAINSTTGMITWIPTSQQTGVQEITAELNDGSGTTTQSFTIIVENVNDAPAITSMPETKTYEEFYYTYQAAAADADEDRLAFSLAQAPSGMVIDSSTGLVIWSSNFSHVGNNSVVVNVSDGSLATQQSFTIVVENINDAPEIESVPPATATVGSLYVYDVNATDPDNDALSYSLAASPSAAAGKIKIAEDTGIITWTPKSQAEGDNAITIEVSDGNLSNTQKFTVKVLPKKEETASPGLPADSISGGRGSGGGGIASGIATPEQQEKQATEVRTFVVEGGKAPVRELHVRLRGGSQEASVEVKAFAERPGSVASIQKRVYSYLQIDRVNLESSDIEEATIEFSVDKPWLSRNKLEPGNVALHRYSNKEWQELSTTLISQDESSANYEATTPGFSIFAIAVRSEAGIEEVNSISTFQLASPLPSAYPISGIILQQDRKTQVSTGTPFTIKNLNTNDTAEGITGIGTATGMFFALINGKPGDKVAITVRNGTESAGAILELSGNMENLLLAADFGKGKLTLLKTKAGSGLDGITGLSIADRFDFAENKGTYGILAVDVVIVLAVLVFRKQVRKPKKKPAKKRKRKGKKRAGKR